METIIVVNSSRDFEMIWIKFPCILNWESGDNERRFRNHLWVRLKAIIVVNSSPDFEMYLNKMSSCNWESGDNERFRNHLWVRLNNKLITKDKLSRLIAEFSQLRLQEMYADH